MSLMFFHYEFDKSVYMMDSLVSFEMITYYSYYFLIFAFWHSHLVSGKGIACTRMIYAIYILFIRLLSN